MWTSTDTRLVVTAAAVVAVVIVLITSRLRLHAFPALMVGSLALGLVAGLGPSKTVDSFTDGVGGTLGDVGVVLGLGTMLGKLLAESGGADLLAETLLRRSGHRTLPWAVAGLAMLLGIPLFFEIGVVLVLPIVFTVAVRMQRSRDGADRGGGGGGARAVAGSPILLVGIPALAGLSALHAFIPPHPGPLVAVDALHADLGRTLLIGLVLAIPTVAIAGPLFARYAARWATADPPAALLTGGGAGSGPASAPAPPASRGGTTGESAAAGTTAVADVAQDDPPVRARPGLAATLVTILTPVALMLVRTVADVALPEGSGVRTVADFVGEPVVALLLALLLAVWTFGFRRGLAGSEVSSLAASGLVPAASIFVIIGAGGGFKQVLVDSGVGDSLAKAATATGVPVLLLAWFVAVLIRLATGSATVATVTAAGIVAPILAVEPGVEPALAVLAVGAGSVFFSHVNDAGFWLVREYFGMSVRDTFRTWSVMETLVSVVGIVLVLAASLVSESPAGPVVLGVDVGTTATKAVAYAADGRAHAAGEAGYELSEPEPGAAVQDPEAVWDAVGDAVREAVAALPAGTEVAAVSFSSAMHGLLPLDDAGDPLGPLLTWADARGADTAARLRRSGDALALHRRTGVPVHPMSPLVKLAWLRRARPSLHDAAATWGGIKEFVLARAAGLRVTDRSCASGTGLLGLDGGWDDGALDVAGITAAALGELVGTTARVGRLGHVDWDLAAGTPVVAGGGDGPLANLGVGAVRPGIAACSIGTSGALRVTVDRPGVDGRGRVFCYGLADERWVVGGAVTNGGVVLDWARETLRPDAGIPDLLDMAATVPAGADGLLALPHLLLERAPHWDAAGAGVLVGLRRRHGAAHIVRALLEGVCLQLRLVLDSMREAGMEVDTVRATGGFARNPFWAQMLTDALGMPVSFPADHEGSAFGAALLGMQGVGLLDPGPDALAEAADRVPAGEVLEPGADAEVYADRLALHERTHEALTDVLEALGP